MRIIAVLAAGTLSACASSVTVPDGPVLYEVPQAGTASTSGGGDQFTSTIEGALADGGAVAGAPMQTTPLDDDFINPMDYTLQQQKIDAAAAERNLAEARSQLVVIPPSSLPNRVDGVNVALYAQQTTNVVGQRIYRRSGGRLGSACGRYGTADDAQRAFLAAGGPETDSIGLDPDGDGFACRWDPTPYRQLRL